MTRRWTLALVLLAAATLARGETDLRARLDRISALVAGTSELGAPATRQLLRARADKGSAAAKELLDALSTPQRADALAQKLAPFDPDGALAARVRTLARLLETRRRARTALAGASQWSGSEDLFAGAESAGNGLAPAYGISVDRSREAGGNSIDASASAELAPGGRAPELDLSVTGSRRLNNELRAYASADAYRDELLGIRLGVGVEAGVKADVLHSSRQTLTVGAGAGAAYERDAVGRPYSSPTTTLNLDYTLKLTSRLKVEQTVAAQRFLDFGSNNYDSVTSLVWRLSRRWSVKLSHELVRDDGAVTGYPAQRSETLLSLVAQ
ncbi:MAG: DUF481 domain-containing protein [Elusimicrobia bacterium]|nr:DUF481 domain-containing protein [Elusimicrobiota bacterium]